MGHDGLIQSIHKTDEAAFFVKVGSVINEVVALGEITVRSRWLLKPIIFDLFKLKGTVAGEVAELPD